MTPVPSAAPTGAPAVRISVKVHGGGVPAPLQEVSVPSGTLARDVVRGLGLFTEGCGLWWEGEPVPADFPLNSDGTLEIVRTFSGG